jgi:TRAP-type C4-dicarboxylate transport system substrate-binding protein
MRAALVLLLSMFTTAGRADQRVLRFATAGPDGTSWARLINSVGADILRQTNGAVRIKWYFGGIAGDELEAARRMQAGELDGMISGGPYCERVMPSMRVLGVPAMFQDRAEAAYVMHALLPDLDREARRAGYALLVTTGLGPAVIFSRVPIRSMAELRRVRLWDWDIFDREVVAEQKMGMNVVPAPVERSGREYDDNKLDGFIGVPAAALAFQWSVRARYIVDIRSRYLTACVLMRNASLDRLPVDHQSAIRTAFAGGDARFEELGRRMDEQLLGGLFFKQGLQPVTVSENFRSQFFEAARKAREKLGEEFMSRDLIMRVEHLLANYRAEHTAR